MITLPSKITYLYIHVIVFFRIICKHFHYFLFPLDNPEFFHKRTDSCIFGDSPCFYILNISTYENLHYVDDIGRAPRMFLMLRISSSFLTDIQLFVEST